MTMTNKFLHDVEKLSHLIWFRRNKDKWFDVFIGEKKVLDVAPYMKNKTYEMEVENHKGEKVFAYIIGYDDAIKKMDKLLKIYHKTKFEKFV